MSLETPARIIRELASRGYNADREAVTLLARAGDPDRAIEHTLDSLPESALKLSAEHVRATVDTAPARPREGRSPGGSTVSPGSGTDTGPAPADDPPDDDRRYPSVSTGDLAASDGSQTNSPVETEGLDAGTSTTQPSSTTGVSSRDRSSRSLSISNDITGKSTGTGDYGDFVAVFRDRYERLSRLLRSRVKHRPIETIREMPGGAEVTLVGMIADIRSTRNGHHLIELEDTTGTFPCLLVKRKDVSEAVDELLYDEVIAIEGTLSDDTGICFVDSLHFPNVPRTHHPSRADRHVRAALVSDVHVGSQEFRGDAWSRFADWLHSEDANAVEYLLIAGDMVEGVGVYPGQDEELDVVDIYEQYELFAEYLKEVPGDMEIVMIPGNHDAVRLAEPQPGFEDDLREIMSAHDARITSNPSMVTIEGVSVLMYHGVSLDEVIAELPAAKASYDDPHEAMTYLLKKRHVAPQYGGHIRLAPEERDYLVMDEVPDVFHTGHVHKLGYGKHRNVLLINSGCWQDQTAFQKRVNIDPDVGYAPIVDLATLEMSIQKFT